MPKNAERRGLDAVHETLSAVFAPVHREGWPFIGGLAVLSLLFGALYGPLGWIGALVTAWCVYFFRNPDRVTPARDGLVVSPADGIVKAVGRAAPPAELGLDGGTWTRVSIFLNIFDVHIQRAPVDGLVLAAKYRHGRFFNAALDKASEDNERMALSIGTEGREIAVVQIAGLIARRIKCWVEPGQDVRAGERYGLIRFGSRVDLYLPEGVAPLVAEGQRMIGGETVMADLHGNEPPRGGEPR